MLCSSKRLSGSSAAEVEFDHRPIEFNRRLWSVFTIVPIAELIFVVEEKEVSRRSCRISIKMTKLIGLICK